MPIDPDKVLGATLESAPYRWDADDVILYHLGVGAGVPPTDANELSYTYEAKLKVLPSFAVLPAFPAIMGVVMADGVQVNPMLILHGEQSITLDGPIPTSGSVTSKGKVVGVYDKGEGKGAVLVAEIESFDEGGTRLFANRFAIFARGEGGFGGDSGPQPGNEPPAREPDFVVESPTMVQQAALYRLNGDKNPLHIDPDFSKMGGYDTPILHGLCSYGVVCKAVVDRALDGDVGQVAGYEARFGGVLFPGETIVTSLWRESDRIVLSASCKERGTPVIKNAAVVLK